MVQIALIIAATLVFFVLERVLPGRELPEAPGWYVRAAFLNAAKSVSSCWLVLHGTNGSRTGPFFTCPE